LPPEAEQQWWYQYYFATERGRAGYDEYRRGFAKLIWRIASPEWNFEDATFDRTAASFDNPDHVDIVIHNYRWRLGLSEGEAQYGSSRVGLPKGRSSRCRRSRSRATRTVRRIPSRVRTPRSSRARIRIGRSRAALDTTFPKKLRKRSPEEQRSN
jgi:hypothetical protein